MSRPKIPLDQLLGDPLGALGRARDEHWLADTETGPPVALRHEHVRELLGDDRLQPNFPEFLRGFGVTSGPFYDWMSMSPLNRGGAEHTRWRTLMARTFTPRSVERLRPFLGEAAHELIDGFAARGACEFMAEFADVYPSLGLCELIGVPTDDRDRFRSWANTIGLGFNPFLLTAHIAEIDAALEQLLAYTSELAARRLAEPRDDLVTRIAEAGRDAGWTAFEVHGSIAGLVFAGHETTKNQLGWTIFALSGQPELWDAVADGSAAVKEVVEEVLRYRGAAAAIGRTPPAAVELAGERLEAGSAMLVSLWSANHDPAAYPRPDRLAPQENKEPHLAFGHGAHYCLGAALARAELQEALLALCTRLTCPVLEPGAAWKPPVGITGPERLPIRFGARA